MKLNFTLIIIIFTPFINWGQIKIELTKISQNGNLFDVVVNSYNQPNDHELHWSHYDVNPGDVYYITVNSGDTLHSMHINEDVFMCDTIGYNGPEGLLATTSLPGTVYDYHINIINPSTPISYDGIFEITFDYPAFNLTQPITGHYNGAVTGNYPMEVALETTDSITYRLVGFGPGMISINFQSWIWFFSGDPDFQLCNNTLDYTASSSNPTNGCNGMVNLTLTNAVGPVNYIWNNASIPNVSGSTELCQGSYEVIAVDSLSNCRFADFILFDPADPYYVNNPSANSGVFDTITYLINDCNFDFSGPIDSINYVQSYLDTTSYPNDYIAFNIDVYSNGSVTGTSGGFQTPDYHNVFLEVYIFCVSAEDPIFQARKVVVNTQQALILGQSEVTMTIGYPDDSDYFIYSIPPASENAKLGGEYYVKIENTGSVDLVNWKLNTFWKALNNTMGVVQKTVINASTGEIILEGPVGDMTLGVGESIVINGESLPALSVEDWIEFLPRNTTITALGQPVNIVYETQGTESLASYQVQKVYPVDESRKTFTNQKIVSYFPITDAENAWCSLQRYGQNIDQLRVQLYSISPQGVLRAGQDLPAGIDPIADIDYWFDYIDSLGVVDYCIQNGIELVPVTYNYNSDINDFDQNSVHTMISNSAIKAQYINGLNQLLVLHPEFSGIDVDFENLLAADRDDYSLFMEDLAQDVHDSGKILTTAVHSKIGSGTWYGPQAQDYERLGNAVDELLLMTYDLHWATSPTSNNPPLTAGCQSTPDWMNDVAAFAISEIDDPSKIQLGLPFYGYRWKEGFEMHTLNDPGIGLTYTDARALMEQYGVTSGMIQRESHGNEPNFTVNIDGINWVCYYQDSASIGYKLSALNEYDLKDYIGGVGVWRLGQENDGMWKAVVEAVKGSEAIIENVVCSGQLGTPTLENESSLGVYPNPCDDLLTVNYKGESAVLIVRDAIGQMVYQFPIEQGTKELSTAQLSDGVYYLSINNVVSKVVINH